MKRKISNDINGDNHNVVVVGRFRNRQKWVDELRGIGTAFEQAISRLGTLLKKSEHTGNNRIDMELAVGCQANLDRPKCQAESQDSLGTTVKCPDPTLQDDCKASELQVFVWTLF